MNENNSSGSSLCKNLYEQIKELKLEDLAKFLVRKGIAKEFDYEFDGQSEYPVDKFVEEFFTSDGESFFFKEDAILHQIELLQSECKEINSLLLSE